MGRCGKVAQQKQDATQGHPSAPRDEASFGQLKELEVCRSVGLYAEDIRHWGVCQVWEFTQVTGEAPEDSQPTLG